jgi:uncharacterized damage-inducible protein DinB
MPRISLPAVDEYEPYYGKYVALVPGDVFATLESQAKSTARLLGATSEEKGGFRYAQGKWSVKEVVGHIADAERVFAYRALRFARADTTELPGFDENSWVPAGGFDRRMLAALAGELAAVRAATLALVGSFDEAALARRGTANGVAMSVRALATIIAGHQAHHVGLLRERYGLTG